MHVRHQLTLARWAASSETFILAMEAQNCLATRPDLST